MFFFYQEFSEQQIHMMNMQFFPLSTFAPLLLRTITWSNILNTSRLNTSFIVSEWRDTSGDWLLLHVTRKGCVNICEKGDHNYSTVGCRRTVCQRTAKVEFYLKIRTTPGWKIEFRTVSLHANNVCCEDDFSNGIADFETTPRRRVERFQPLQWSGVGCVCNIDINYRVRAISIAMRLEDGSKNKSDRDWLESWKIRMTRAGTVWEASPVRTQEGGHRCHPALKIVSFVPGSNGQEPPGKLGSYRPSQKGFTPRHDGGSFHRCDKAWLCCQKKKLSDL